MEKVIYRRIIIKYVTLLLIKKSLSETDLYIINRLLIIAILKKDLNKNNKIKIPI